MGLVWGVWWVFCWRRVTASDYERRIQRHQPTPTQVGFRAENGKHAFRKADRSCSIERFFAVRKLVGAS